MPIIFKSLYWICYNIGSVLCFWVFWPCSMWDLSSPARGRNHTPFFGRWSLNHWTTKEVPKHSFKKKEGPHYSVQFNLSVVSDSLRPYEPQHARPPCLSLTPRVHLNSCPLSRWCHPTISSSVVPFSSCPQSFPAPGSFQMSLLFAWGGQSIGVSLLASVLPKNTDLL